MPIRANRKELMAPAPEPSIRRDGTEAPADAGPPDLIVLSPHPDDAILSCGGAMAAAAADGRRVMLITVFTADPVLPLSPTAAAIHREMGLETASTETRRREDQCAAEIIGAPLVHWNLPDAMYRRNPDTGDPVYPNRRDLYGPIRDADRHTEDTLVARIAALPPCRELWGPAGIGGHVDHRLVRRALERSLRGSILWYEDFPYAKKWRARVRVLHPFRYRLARRVPLDASLLDRKCRAIQAYASQVQPLFGGPARMRAAVEHDARRRGGESLWRRTRLNPPAPGPDTTPPSG
jgi:LmbE family N-acetylglucosaminyl deacetylase